MSRTDAFAHLVVVRTPAQDKGTRDGAGIAAEVVTGGGA